MNWKPIFLGAEGCAETADKPLVRDATTQDYDEHAPGILDAPDARDNTGRPYFLVMVDVDSAPQEAINKVEHYYRVRRLIG